MDTGGWFWVYVLQSATCGRYYCGHTDDLARRVAQHNDPAYRSSRTTKRWPGPWRLVWQSAGLPTRAAAVTLERRVKKRGLRRHLQDHGVALVQLSR